MSTPYTSQNDGPCPNCGSTVLLGRMRHHLAWCLRSSISLPSRCAQYPLCSLEKGHVGPCKKVSRATEGGAL